MQDPLTEDDERISESASFSLQKSSALAGGEAELGTHAPDRVEVHTPSSYCPVCSERLEARRCKLVCAVCGYYMSCSDYC